MWNKHNLTSLSQCLNINREFHFTCENFETYVRGLVKSVFISKKKNTNKHKHLITVLWIVDVNKNKTENKKREGITVYYCTRFLSSFPAVEGFHTLNTAMLFGINTVKRRGSTNYLSSSLRVLNARFQRSTSSVRWLFSPPEQSSFSSQPRITR